MIVSGGMRKNASVLSYEESSKRKRSAPSCQRNMRQMARKKGDIKEVWSRTTRELGSDDHSRRVLSPLESGGGDKENGRTLLTHHNWRAIRGARQVGRFKSQEKGMARKIRLDDLKEGEQRTEKLKTVAKRREKRPKKGGRLRPIAGGACTMRGGLGGGQPPVAPENRGGLRGGCRSWGGKKSE